MKHRLIFDLEEKDGFVMVSGRMLFFYEVVQLSTLKYYSKHGKPNEAKCIFVGPQVVRGCV